LSNPWLKLRPFAKVSLPTSTRQNIIPTASHTAVAATIKSDPGTFSSAILGAPPDEYIAKILKPNTWGGAIELAALATHYRTEIASVDVETGRVDHFSPPEGTSATGQRCIVLYSGIHYDAATLAPVPEAPAEWHQTVFPILARDESDPVLLAAKKLAGILRSKHAFTNTATFDLRCEVGDSLLCTTFFQVSFLDKVCKKGLKGEKEAREHAAETGHTSFGEY
jgi:ubiquitin thioesterase OTU1